MHARGKLIVIGATSVPAADTVLPTPIAAAAPSRPNPSGTTRLLIVLIAHHPLVERRDAPRRGGTCRSHRCAAPSRAGGIADPALS